MHIEQYMDWRVWWVESRDTSEQDVSTVSALGYWRWNTVFFK